MGWKAIGLALGEFVGGLSALRIGMPESYLLVAVGGLATALGLFQLSRALAPPPPDPEARAYRPRSRESGP